MKAVQVRVNLRIAHVDRLPSFLDMRLPSSKAAAQQRSINLAISHRGIAALEAIDPAATRRFLQTVIPMRGRMIHHLKGQLDSQLYDRDGQVRIFVPPKFQFARQTRYDQEQLIPCCGFCHLNSVSIQSIVPCLTKLYWRKFLPPEISVYFSNIKFNLSTSTRKRWPFEI
jgi:hypothetical protein